MDDIDNLMSKLERVFLRAKTANGEYEWSFERDMFDPNTFHIFDERDNNRQYTLIVRL